jgi:hypothetical protein
MLILKVIFGFIFVFMLYSTIMASLELNLFHHLPTLLKDPWAVMTLYDAYFAFLFFYIWFFYKEKNWIVRIIGFVLVVGLGTIFMSLYMLVLIFRLPQGGSFVDILLSKEDLKSI